MIHLTARRLRRWDYWTRSDSIHIEDGQLVATGVVSRDTPAAGEVVPSSRNGFPWQASVGAGYAHPPEWPAGHGGSDR